MHRVHSVHSVHCALCTHHGTNFKRSINDVIDPMTALKKHKVFIIDDNEMTRSVLRMIVQGDKYEVVGEASNAKSGLERVLALRPQLVFLDIMLPDANGLEVLTQIMAAFPQTAVLMVTASNDRETVRNAIQHGASGFIVKPFNEKTVIGTMDRLIPN